MVFPFSLRSSIQISLIESRSTDLREVKLSPHKSSITFHLLRNGKITYSSIIFCDSWFDQNQTSCCNHSIFNPHFYRLR